jgi:hypothetical protein
MQLLNTLAPGSLILSALHPLATHFSKVARGESGGLEDMLDGDAGLASTGNVPRATEMCGEESGRVGIVGMCTPCTSTPDKRATRETTKAITARDCYGYGVYGSSLWVSYRQEHPFSRPSLSY